MHSITLTFPYILQCLLLPNACWIFIGDTQAQEREVGPRGDYPILGRLLACVNYGLCNMTPLRGQTFGNKPGDFIIHITLPPRFHAQGYIRQLLCGHIIAHMKVRTCFMIHVVIAPYNRSLFYTRVPISRDQPRSFPFPFTWNVRYALSDFPLEFQSVLHNGGLILS